MVIENFSPLLRKLDFVFEFSIPLQQNGIAMILLPSVSGILTSFIWHGGLGFGLSYFSPSPRNVAYIDIGKIYYSAHRLIGSWIIESAAYRN